MERTRGKKECVFLYVNCTSTSVRYLLRTNILRTLASSNVDVVILSHHANEPEFRKEFECNNIVVELCNREAYTSYFKDSIIQRFLRELRCHVLNTRTIDDFYRALKSNRSWNLKGGGKRFLKGLFFDLARVPLKKSRWLRSLLIRLESYYFSPEVHKDTFYKYRPNLVVTTSPGWWDYDQFIIREAHSHAIPVVSVILSWDHTTCMGMFGSNPDFLVVWTENMKRELIELHNVDENKIFVGGVAPWDRYYDRNIIERSTVFRELGLDESKKTIIFLTKSPTRYIWTPQLIADLAECIEKEFFNYPVQILVRLHPIHYMKVNAKQRFQSILDAYKKVVEKYPFVIINYPKMSYLGMDDSETSFIASILKYSDLMLNMFSTMVIEAAIFDLPSINICIRGGFDDKTTKNMKQDIMIDYFQDHNQRVIRTGGVKSVFTIAELYGAINEYLDNPELDKKGRILIQENEAGPFRGNAGEMIGHHILSLMDIKD